MPLIRCSECGRDISDKAAACPGCGAPVQSTISVTPSNAPALGYDRSSDTFSGTLPVLVKLAMRAVQSLGWKLDQVNESLGMVTFQTGVSWGSWSGVSCSVTIEELKPNVFRVAGTGKQNLAGAQLIALNIGGEAQNRARKAIDKMKELAVHRN